MDPRHLDPSQKRILTNLGGKSLVIAGAGSGKTRVLIARTLALLDKGMPGSRILLLTFSNKAAREMSDRLKAALSDGQITVKGGLPNVATYHRFGYLMLRRYWQEANLAGRDFTMLDEHQSDRLIADAGVECGLVLEDDRAKLIQLRDWMGNQGYTLCNAKHYKPSFKQAQALFEHDETARMAMDAMMEYQLKKDESNTVDFDDLIRLPRLMLQRNPEVLTKQSAFFKSVCVDEFQDTNLAQYQFLRTLFPPNGSHDLCVVGDDDQSIYRWRGARPENLRAFERDYQPKVFYLENNYRCGKRIVGAGMSIISRNGNRFDKRCQAANEHDGEVDLRRFKDLEGMADKIAADIERRIQAGEALSEIAVLYRRQLFAEPLDRALTARGIKTIIHRGTSLMDRAEVRMLAAAGKLAFNPKDRLAASRLADLVPGLGEKRLAKVFAAAEDRVGWTAAMYDTLPASSHTAVEAVFDSLSVLRRRGPSRLLDWAQSCPYFQEWLRKRTKGDDVRVNKMDGRLSAFQDNIDHRLESLPEMAPEKLWGHIMDVLVHSPEERAGLNAVTLSTIHGAKGMEWDTVYIAGFSDGIMPSRRLEDGETDDPEKLAEERNTCYVAFTRARKHLVLCHADYVPGFRQRLGVSPYVVDIRDLLPQVSRQPMRKPGDGFRGVRSSVSGQQKDMNTETELSPR